jgi:hypothetical protein
VHVAHVYQQVMLSVQGTAKWLGTAGRVLPVRQISYGVLVQQHTIHIECLSYDVAG